MLMLMLSKIPSIHTPHLISSILRCVHERINRRMRRRTPMLPMRILVMMLSMMLSMGMNLSLSMRMIILIILSILRRVCLIMHLVLWHNRRRRLRSMTFNRTIYRYVYIERIRLPLWLIRLWWIRLWLRVLLCQIWRLSLLLWLWLRYGRRLNTRKQHSLRSPPFQRWGRHGRITILIPTRRRLLHHRTRMLIPRSPSLSLTPTPTPTSA